MTDQQQRTQWAIQAFGSFTEQWTAPVLPNVPEFNQGADNVARAIQAIAPKDTNEPIGYAVFRREIDTDWDIRQRPSGFVHTLISAVFDKPAHAENAHQGASKRHPENHYIICEIREAP